VCRPMKSDNKRVGYAEILRMDAYELRMHLTLRLANWKGGERHTRWFYDDVKRLAAMAGMSVEDVLTELRQDVELIE